MIMENVNAKMAQFALGQVDKVYFINFLINFLIFYNSTFQ